MPEENQNQTPQANNANPAETIISQDPSPIQQQVPQQAQTIPQQQPMIPPMQQQVPMMPPMQQQMPMMPPMQQQMPMMPPMQQQMPMMPPMQQQMPTGQPEPMPLSPQGELMPNEEKKHSLTKALFLPIMIISILAYGSYYIYNSKSSLNKSSVINHNQTEDSIPNKTIPPEKNTLEKNSEKLNNGKVAR